MTDLARMRQQLADRVDWQRMPVDMEAGEYERQLSAMLVEAIEYMFIKTGRCEQYDPARIVYGGDNDDLAMELGGYDMPLDEQHFVLTYAQISFFQKVRTDVNNIVGYTTDALTVTNADKPYQYLTGTIAELRQELRDIYYTMVRHVHL